MKRRQFLVAGAAAATAALSAPLISMAGTAGQTQKAAAYPGFPVSYVAEFRVTPPQQKKVMTVAQELAIRLKGSPEFLGVTLKQMRGTSTMVKNYPPEYKGILANANAQATAQGRLPFYNILMVRFAHPTALQNAKLAEWLQDRLVPHLDFTPPGSAEPAELLPLAGVYASLLAGDRKKVFDSGPAIASFLAQQEDTPERRLVTVVNHVMVPDDVHGLVEAKVGPLLKVAQNTFEPKSDANGLGQPGSKENLNYRKAFSTEILANTNRYGSLRSYLMHGVWDSVWDHENSHLDPRFQQAFMQVAPYVVSGPSEPFYHTLLLMNRA
jgi:hypothetical protein